MSDVNVNLFYFFNHDIHNPILNTTMPFITHVGGFIWMVVIVVAIILYAKLKNKDTLKRIAVLALVALLFSDIIVLCIKHLVNEPRPFVSLNNVNLLIVEEDPFSFPSGHASSTLSVVTVFVLNMRELFKKHYRLINIAMIVFALVILFSRVYVGVHYPIDVVCGAIIGIITALIVNRYKNDILGFSPKQRFLGKND
jgi:undecaprenyl-diphosphatase